MNMVDLYHQGQIAVNKVKKIHNKQEWKGAKNLS